LQTITRQACKQSASKRASKYDPSTRKQLLIKRANNYRASLRQITKQAGKQIQNQLENNCQASLQIITKQNCKQLAGKCANNQAS